MPDPRGRIFEIQRFSIHDGPGIRTTVFLQGCPLTCLWCHNPEGHPSRSLLSFEPGKCVGCGYCLRTCPQQAHKLVEGKHVLDRGLCLACGRCTAECHAGALNLVGREVTVSEVMSQVLQDVAFYLVSGGGVTLSGGEPLCQIDFAYRLLQVARAEGLSTAVETSGAVPYEHLERVRPLVDLFLYDVKETDAERHRQFTGVSNEMILDNLWRLHRCAARIRLRLPLIPGYNDRPEHFLGVVRLAASLPALEAAEIMPYHRLGTSKAARLGLVPTVDLESPSAATVDGWVEAFAGLGLRVINRRTTAPPSWSSRRDVDFR
ncbi:MAG: glycyl-radical enzyme activating protein [Candidatus Latescibacterota bacterium]